MNKVTNAFICSTVAVGLLFTHATPMEAQSVPPPPVDEVAETESTVEDETTFDIGGTVIQAAEQADTNVSKPSVQEADKAFAGAEGTAYIEPNKAEPAQIFLPLVESTVEQGVSAASAPTAYWRTIKYENFDGYFPGYKWRTYDCNGSTGGYRNWNDTNWIAYSGNWSAWPAGGGRNAVNPNYSYYGNRACTWMIYGPFSLRFAQSARLNFKLWNQTERNYDHMGWYVSCNGANFYGSKTSGNTNGWRNRSLGLNRCLGDSTVWVGFKFTSDHSITDDGSFIDNVHIQQYR